MSGDAGRAIPIAVLGRFVASEVGGRGVCSSVVGENHQKDEHQSTLSFIFITA